MAENEKKQELTLDELAEAAGGLTRSLKSFDDPIIAQTATKTFEDPIIAQPSTSFEDPLVATKTFEVPVFRK